MKRIVLTSTLITLAACGGSDRDPANPSDPAATRICGAPSFEDAGWDKPGSRLVVALGEPVHAADDVVARAGRGATMEAKFAYGPTSKDLQSETVRAAIRYEGDCTWLDLGEAKTDDDGRARLDIDASLLDVEGRYEVRWSVAGDGSEVTAWVYRVGAGQPAVVFDIDGTLTTSDIEAVDGIVLQTVGSTSETLIDLAGSPLSKEQWMWGLEQVLEEDADMYRGADELVRYYADLGYLPIFVTGRPYLFQAMSRRWLAARGMRAGPLFHVQDVDDALPMSVARYKADVLAVVAQAGVDVRYAYGNATTDICAYRDAGIDEGDTFIIGKHGGEGCEEGDEGTVAVVDYPSHLEGLRGE